MVTGRLPPVGSGSPPTGLVSSDNTRVGAFQADGLGNGAKTPKNTMQPVFQSDLGLGKENRREPGPLLDDESITELLALSVTQVLGAEQFPAHEYSLACFFRIGSFKELVRGLDASQVGMKTSPREVVIKKGEKDQKDVHMVIRTEYGTQKLGEMDAISYSCVRQPES